MAEKDLIIGLKVDRSQASQANQQAIAEARQVVEAQKQVGDATEAAAKRQAQAAGQARDEQGRFVSGTKEATDATNEMGKVGESAFAKFGVASALAQVGLNKVLDVVRAIGDGVEAAASKQEQLSKQFAGQRDRLGELASLEGKTLDNAYTLQFAQFGAETGMRFDEALKLRTEFLNSGAQYISKTISESEAARLQVQAGQLALAMKLAPEQVGDLAGNLLFL